MVLNQFRILNPKTTPKRQNGIEAFRYRSVIIYL